MNKEDELKVFPFRESLFGLDCIADDLEIALPTSVTVTKSTSHSFSGAIWVIQQMRTVIAGRLWIAFVWGTQLIEEVLLQLSN